jgi:hypothetical protein
MSIVSDYASDSARTALQRQRRIATVSSVMISLLLVVLVGLVLALVLLPGILVESSTIVTYQAAKIEEEQVDRPKLTPQVQRKPSAPSASMARVIASSTPSTTAIPVPEVEVPDLSADFGNRDDFGQGWGSGSGSGAGGTTFFGQSVRAERIAYVIDFSSSMKGQGREELMREELMKSLDQITDGVQFGMVFFAGPAWVAGDEVKGKVVTAPGGKTFKWMNKGGSHGWEHDGRKESSPWFTASRRSISDLKKTVEETKLVGGTVWDNPLNMALDMEPPPQIIYFMTDGAAQGSDVWAKEVGERAKKMGVTINCIAMMQPRAHDDLDSLAKKSGGQFTIVLAGGKREKVR